jgi:hypothetical protein
LFTAFEFIYVEQLLGGLYCDMRAESQNSGVRRDGRCKALVQENAPAAKDTHITME